MSRLLLPVLLGMVLSVSVASTATAKKVESVSAKAKASPKKVESVSSLLSKLPACESLETCKAALSLISRGPAIWPALGAGLRAPDELTRFWTLGILSEVVVKGAVGAISKALGDGEIRVRAAAAYALGAQRDKIVTPHLLRALKDPDLNVRFAVVVAMGRVKDRATVGALIGALRDKDEDVRGYAAFALGDLRDRRATARLCERLREDLFPKVRGMSAMALGSLKDPASRETLLERLREEDDPKALAAAIYALAELRDPTTRAAIEAHKAHASSDVRQYVVAALKTLDEKP